MVKSIVEFFLEGGLFMVKWIIENFLNLRAFIFFVIGGSITTIIFILKSLNRKKLKKYLKNSQDGLNINDISKETKLKYKFIFNELCKLESENIIQDLSAQFDYAKKYELFIISNNNLL